LYDLPIDAWVMPIGILYYFWGRYLLAKTFVAGYSCGGCGLCVDNCPVNAVKMLYERPYWTFSCESCMKCMNHCPTDSIHTAHGFTILLWWIIFSFFHGLVFSFAATYFADFIGTSWITKELVYYTTMFLVCMSIAFLTYRILHYLMRFKIISNIIIYTSLTKFKFWGRYRAPAG
jgi:Pyruvate/2-oxoacid:ferredoxin oxidoreductase delta subunit